MAMPSAIERTVLWCSTNEDNDENSNNNNKQDDNDERWARKRRRTTKQLPEHYQTHDSARRGTSHHTLCCSHSKRARHSLKMATALKNTRTVSLVKFNFSSLFFSSLEIESECAECMDSRVRCKRDYMYAVAVVCMKWQTIFLFVAPFAQAKNTAIKCNLSSRNNSVAQRSLKPHTRNGRVQARKGKVWPGKYSHKIRW